MEPFPPAATSADYRNERKALVYSQIANVIAFTESPACSDSDLQDMSIHIAVMMARIHIMANSEASDTRFATSQLVVPQFHPQFSNSATVSAMADSMNGNANLGSHSASTADHGKVNNKVLSIANGGLVQVLEGPRNMRKKKMAARKLVMNETTASEMFGNLSLRVRKVEKKAGDEVLSAEGMDMDQVGA
ncbi:hypothetical protein VTL71DRAFT_14913 [Oculimacula yallundae]|uniref:Uncharacterized protein n=1 Tax=Oculimacula yallundae TaxID=86028 RepID=A0ABR4CF43_9HELO